MTGGAQETTILMVEDDEGHARLIEKNLRRVGMTNTLIHFTSGQQALDYLMGMGETPRAEQLLMLLDLNLPEMDGCEVLKKIRAYEATKFMPVIILTTTENPAEIRRCYECGCSLYVSKPVEYEAFADAISKLGMLLPIVKLPKVG